MKKHIIVLFMTLLLIGSLWSLYDGTGTFTKITSLADLEDGYYVITNNGDGSAMNKTNAGSYFSYTAITPSEGTITNPSADIVWRIDTVEGSKTIFNEVSSKYVSYSGSGNNAYAEDNADTNNQKWTITYVGSDFTVANKANSTRVLQYNNSNPRFACYTSAQQKLHLYKLDIGDTPTMQVSTNNLTGFTYIFGNGPSATQTFTVSGSNLTGGISITADYYEFAISSTGDYTDELEIADIDGTVATKTVYIRLKAGLAEGNHNDYVIVSSDVLDDVNISCSGTVTPQVPTMTVSTNALTGFTYIAGDGPSATKTFTVSGMYLEDDIIIISNDEYEISLNQSTGFSNELVIPADEGTIETTTVYVRLAAGLAIGSYNKSILVGSGSLDEDITCAGTVTAPAPTVQVLLRPSHVDISNASSESAVLMKASYYADNDFRYRLYNAGDQYNCWNGVNYISTSSYGDNPLVPGTPSSSSTWWIIYERGTNNNTTASYRDRQGPGYSSNYQTQTLPAATSMTNTFTLSGDIVGAQFDLTEKYVVLGFAGETLVTATPTALNTGAYELLAPVGTTITRLEVRSVLDEILFTKDGEWDETTGDMTLPVTLSSFTATLTSTGNAVLLKWTTQSETDLMGYYIYRSNEDNQSTANRQSELISANNTNSESNYVWSDTELEDGVYYYWLKVVERNGETEIHGSVKATINNDSPQTPDYEAQTVFNSIYPNPFNPTTTIFYALGEVSNVKVSIYNVKGELVKNYDMANQSIGDHKIVWNGFDNNNKACTSGIYFFRVETDSYSMTKKAVMIK